MKIAFFMFAAFLLLSQTNSSHASDYTEPGRFGVEGTISANGAGSSFQFGPTIETDQFEAAIDLDASTSTQGNTATGDLGLEVRAGKRVNIGDFNYLSFGADFGTSILSKQDGVSNNGSFTVGPYVGFQRHFSGSHLMLTIYVLPLAYSYTPAFGGSGVVTSWQFFQQGSFGIAYLF